ncbi:hypothetical protein ACFS2C_09485 [Prauserella oleivorans]|uniref:Uncharacterized protein n=1 Tax=Prauserella oleivorans TaxID=1478153 RepID=A0ABW5W9G9_9PSEU
MGEITVEVDRASVGMADDTHPHTETWHFSTDSFVGEILLHALESYELPSNYSWLMAARLAPEAEWQDVALFSWDDWSTRQQLRLYVLLYGWDRTLREWAGEDSTIEIFFNTVRQDTPENMRKWFAYRRGGPSPFERR